MQYTFIHNPNTTDASEISNFEFAREIVGRLPPPSTEAFFSLQYLEMRFNRSLRLFGSIMFSIMNVCT
jgi:hypothetical protein